MVPTTAAKALELELVVMNQPPPNPQLQRTPSPPLSRKLFGDGEPQ